MDISGSGQISAGVYNEKISISGSGKINGNIRCIKLYCSGSVKGTGSIYCNEDIKVSGSCLFEKSVFAESIKASGSMKVFGNITTTSICNVSGSIRCSGSIKCSKLVCSGSIDVDNGIEADEVYISGIANCTGLLNAKKIDIILNGLNTINKIGSISGSEIRIHRDNQKGNNIMSLFSKFIGRSNTEKLEVNEHIEGDILTIEYVKSPYVVGRVVVIGSDCEIDLVRYSEKIEIHPDAKIRKCEKI